jgi:hypothetical protein
MMERLLPKSKIHLHYLFRSYLQSDEYLLWVGKPAKNFHIGLKPKPQSLKKLVFTHWRIPLIFVLLYLFIPINLSQLPFGDYLFLLDYAWFICIAALVWFLLNEMFRFGREYYAISTKRLLVLRRHLWKSLDAAPLGLLPDFRLEKGTIRFSPIRIEEKKFRDKTYFIEHHRPYLHGLSPAEAQTAYSYLQSTKNAILDARAREIGLMK